MPEPPQRRTGVIIVGKPRTEFILSFAARTGGKTTPCPAKLLQGLSLIISAAKAGGIHGKDTYPAELICENLTIEYNFIHQTHEAGVQNLLPA